MSSGCSSSQNGKDAGGCSYAETEGPPEMVGGASFGREMEKKSLCFFDFWQAGETHGLCL